MWTYNHSLYHSGTLGMHWGERHWQYPDGRFTPEGKLRYFGDPKKQIEKTHLRSGPLHVYEDVKKDVQDVKTRRKLSDEEIVARQKRYVDYVAAGVVLVGLGIAAHRMFQNTTTKPLTWRRQDYKWRVKDWLKDDHGTILNARLRVKDGAKRASALKALGITTALTIPLGLASDRLGKKQAEMKRRRT